MPMPQSGDNLRTTSLHPNPSCIAPSTEGCLLYLCLGPRGSCLNSLWVRGGRREKPELLLFLMPAGQEHPLSLRELSAQIPNCVLKPARRASQEHLRKLVTQAPSPIHWNQNLHFNKNPWETHHNQVWEALLRLQPKWHISERASSSTSARADLQNPHDGERNTEVTPFSPFH